MDLFIQSQDVTLIILANIAVVYSVIALSWFVFKGERNEMD